jgi:deazaflavin-dependent oxidoreductase (nitroreductase family)
MQCALSTGPNTPPRSAPLALRGGVSHARAERDTVPFAARHMPRPADPFAARLHAIPRAIRPLQHATVRLFRRYFERAPGWVLLTTTGRKTGLPREVLLPCERTPDAIVVISTYGRRSDWIRNLERQPAVRVTAAGWILAATAEVVDDVGAKRALVTQYPFFAPWPMDPINWLHRTLLRPLTVAFLRWWVRRRPIVVIRLRTDGR